MATAYLQQTHSVRVIRLQLQHRLPQLRPPQACVCLYHSFGCKCYAQNEASRIALARCTGPNEYKLLPAKSLLGPARRAMPLCDHWNLITSPAPRLPSPLWLAPMQYSPFMLGNLAATFVVWNRGPHSLTHSLTHFHSTGLSHVSRDFLSCLAHTIPPTSSVATQQLRQTVACR